MWRLAVAWAACLLAALLPATRAVKHHGARSSLAYHRITTVLCGAVADHRIQSRSSSRPTAPTTAAALGQRGDEAFALLCDLAREDYTYDAAAAAIVVAETEGRPWAEEVIPIAPAAPRSAGIGGARITVFEKEAAPPKTKGGSDEATQSDAGAGRVEDSPPLEDADEIMSSLRKTGRDGRRVRVGFPGGTALVDVSARAVPVQGGRGVVVGVGGKGGRHLTENSGGTATTLAEAQALLAKAVAGVMMVIEIMGGILAWTCSTATNCNVFTIPKEISVTLRGIVGADGKKPILDAQGSNSKKIYRRHIYNSGTLVLENLELTRGYITSVRSYVCVSVTVGSACA